MDPVHVGGFPPCPNPSRCRWWCRGGWSPVEVEVTGPGDRWLSATVNDFGENGFYAEDETVVPGTRQMKFMIVLPEGAPNEGTYSVDMMALDDLTYWMDWGVVASDETVLLQRSVEDVPLDAGETRSVQTLVGSDVVRQLVDVDIAPGGEPNCVNSSKKGNLAVAVLSDWITDPLEIDVSTLELDDDDDVATAGVAPVKSDGRKDLNKDKLPDLALHFDVPELSAAGMLQEGAELFLTGALTDGTQIIGSDGIYLAGGSHCR